VKEKLSIGGKINFHKGNASPAAGTLPKAAVFVRGFQSDFINEMDKCRKTGRGGNERHPCLAFPKIAIPGNFPLGF
jgi:hypothetical protein